MGERVQKSLIFVLPGNEPLGDKLARELQGDLGSVTVRRFPDGETYVRYEEEVSGREIILICTLTRPDEKILPLYFLARNARDAGALKVGLVAPYLAYMRQDKRFHEGEGITSVYFAEIISQAFDWMVTVDPHLHRRASLSEVYRIPALALHAAPVLADWILKNVTQPLLIGPDAESEQWVKDVAQGAKAPFIVLQKIRRGDRDVDVSIPEVGRWKDHTPVLVDDIISTATTMMETVGHLRKAGMKPPLCLGVHGVFSEGAYQNLMEAGAGRIVTTNSISHETNEIDLTALLAEGVLKMQGRAVARHAAKDASES